MTGVPDEIKEKYGKYVLIADSYRLYLKCEEHDVFSGPAFMSANIAAIIGICDKHEEEHGQGK
jgi:hypothetical protein